MRTRPILALVAVTVAGIALAAGAIGGNVFGWAGPAIASLVIGGVAACAALIAVAPAVRTPRGRARANAWLSVGLVALAFVLFSRINHAAVTRAFDWTRDARYSLRAKSRAVVAEPGPPIELVVVASPDEADPGGDALSDDLVALAHQYRDAAPARVSVRVFDAARDELAAVHMLRSAGLDPSAQIRPLVLVRVGSRSKVVDRPRLARSGAHGTVEFLGESYVTTAIVELAGARKPLVYFTRGHDEGDESLHALEGYTRFRAAIERDHVELRTVQLARVGDVPADADALVVLRPRRAFTRREGDAIDRYLARGGRVWIALDSPLEVDAAPRELARVTERWGIAIDDVIACDPESNEGGDPVKVWVDRYGGHPTVGSLHGLSTIFLAPRGLRVLDDATSPAGDDLETSVLLETSRRSFAETDVARVRRDGTVGFDRGVDRPGPIAFGALARAGDGARLVVLGDATFLDNVTLERFEHRRATHLALARNLLSWLLERDTWVDMPPRVRGDRRLTVVDVSDRTIRAFTWGGMIGMPLVFLASGLVVWALRRERGGR